MLRTRKKRPVHRSQFHLLLRRPLFRRVVRDASVSLLLVFPYLF